MGETYEVKTGFPRPGITLASKCMTQQLSKPCFRMALMPARSREEPKPNQRFPDALLESAALPHKAVGTYFVGRTMRKVLLHMPC
ncbi:hypothetical protein RRG08_025758 [Elysia crispata]|uniref:Uncharacterized protein n=1 Tax=Elysia crispata TaxID=231223 RepID=A0AAE1AI13_9GAST|nr:hypothetical protein RRG08_025758 [Elysia crispata]